MQKKKKTHAPNTLETNLIFTNIIKISVMKPNSHLLISYFFFQ